MYYHNYSLPYDDMMFIARLSQGARGAVDTHWQELGHNPYDLAQEVARFKVNEIIIPFIKKHRPKTIPKQTPYKGSTTSYQEDVLEALKTAPVCDIKRHRTGEDELLKDFL